MAFSQRLPGVTLFLCKFCAALDVGEQEGDRAGGEISIHIKHSEGYSIQFRAISKACGHIISIQIYSYLWGFHPTISRFSIHCRVSERNFNFYQYVGSDFDRSTRDKREIDTLGTLYL